MAHVSIFLLVLGLDNLRNSATTSIGQTTVRIPVLFLNPDDCEGADTWLLEPPYYPYACPLYALDVDDDVEACDELIGIYPYAKYYLPLGATAAPLLAPYALELVAYGLLAAEELAVDAAELIEDDPPP